MYSPIKILCYMYQYYSFSYGASTYLLYALASRSLSLPVHFKLS